MSKDEEIIKNGQRRQDGTIAYSSETEGKRGIIFPIPIFGPVHSRRLGVSLGVNLLPGDGKVCSFDCIYCECGYNKSFPPHQKLPTRTEVRQALRAKLQEMKAVGPNPDVITFAGNGEPTVHPRFADIIHDTIALRDEFFPEAKISVLCNSTRILREDVFNALLKVDNNILKLDTIDMDYIRMVDRPLSPRFNVEKIIERMMEFGNRCIVQTMFLKGTHNGRDVSNVSDKFVLPWIDAIQRIQPSEVMIYTIDRTTPSPLLEKATPAELDNIADRVQSLGIPCQVSY